MKSNIDRAEPKFAAPKIESVEPNRPKLLSEIVEPRSLKSSTDSCEPKLAQLKIDS